jgi:acyl-CoA synthetase (AMP-forming)/AMP-acid ligase II
VSPRFWREFSARAHDSPDLPVLFDEHGAQLSFGELHIRAERVAAGLVAMGVGEGSRVTWQLPTRIETVVLMLALNRLGAVQNPLIPLYGKRELGFALRQTGAELFVVRSRWRATDHGAIAAQLQEEIGNGLRVLLIDDGLPEADPSALAPPPARSSTAAPPVRWIFYTSGTTADPKGVCHTDESICSAGHALVVQHELAPDDVGSIAFPIAHAGGAQYLASMFQAGFPAVLLERFAPAESLGVMRRHGVTIAGGGTAFYRAVLDEQRRRPETPVLPTLRKLTGGGSAKPPQLFDEVRQELGVPILHGFGMTESPCVAMGALADTDEQLAFTEGAAVPGISIRIVHADGSPAEVWEDGEIEFRGTLVAAGYVDPALTAASFTADGWLRSGDLGHLRDDGHLVVTGRIKDVIIRKGENVSAREVEELLLDHPEIKDVAVIGLPDGERGELVCAVVEILPGGEELDLPRLQAFLRGCGLAILKLPERLEVVDELPRNALGKVLKAELRARFS